MTSSGAFVELQGAGEESTFSAEELNQLINLGKAGIEELIARQQEILREPLQGVAVE
jgi:ribonuclease PH